MAGIAPKYYYLTLSLLGICVVIGLFVAYRFQREVNDDLAPTTEKDLLGPLEKAYYAGLMDEAEFLRIRESMNRGKLDAGPPAPKAPAAPPSPPRADTSGSDLGLGGG